MSPLGRMYTGVGKMMPGAKKKALAAAKTAFTAAPKGAKKAAGQQAMQNMYTQMGKKPTRLALGAGLAGASTMMLPNANQTRGGYKGPTARGTGRYA